MILGNLRYLMISRFKALCALGVALLALLTLTFRAEAATTYPVDVSGAQFLPTPSPLPNLVVGDSVLFKIKNDYHSITLNGTLLLGRIQFSGEEILQTYTTDGTYVYVDSRYGTSFSVVVVQPANAAPIVNLTIPTNHAAILVTNLMTNITLRAEASDDDGTIRRVEFRYGVTTNLASLTNLVGTASNAPYSFVWSNALPGRYLVQARAYDNLEVFANSLRFTLNLYTPFTNTLPVLTNSTQYVFTHTADTNLVYVSDYSTNLTNWTPFVTNVATNKIVQVLDKNTNNFTNIFYRVRLLP